MKRIRTVLFDGSTTQHMVWSPLGHQTTTPVHHHHLTQSRNTDTTVNFTHPAGGQNATNQAETPQKNDHEYDRLDRIQKEHETVATSESPEQNDQHKTSSKGTEGNKELDSAYSRLENQKSDSKKDSEEHIYYILEGPSS